MNDILSDRFRRFTTGAGVYRSAPVRVGVSRISAPFLRSAQIALLVLLAASSLVLVTPGQAEAQTADFPFEESDALVLNENSSCVNSSRVVCFGSGVFSLSDSSNYYYFVGEARNAGFWETRYAMYLKLDGRVSADDMVAVNLDDLVISVTAGESSIFLDSCAFVYNSRHTAGILSCYSDEAATGYMIAEGEGTATYSVSSVTLEFGTATGTNNGCWFSNNAMCASGFDNGNPYSGGFDPCSSENSYREITSEYDMIEGDDGYAEVLVGCTQDEINAVLRAVIQLCDLDLFDAYSACRGSPLSDTFPPFGFADFVLDTSIRINYEQGSWCPEGVGRFYYNYETADDGQGNASGAGDQAQKFYVFCHEDNRSWKTRTEADPVAVFTELVVFRGDLRLIVDSLPDIDLIQLERGYYGIALATLVLTEPGGDDPCDQTGAAQFWQNESPTSFLLYRDDRYLMTVGSLDEVTSVVLDRGDATNDAQGAFRAIGRTRNDIHLCLHASTSQTQVNWMNDFDEDSDICVVPTQLVGEPDFSCTELAIQYQQAASDGPVDLSDDLTAQQRLAQCPLNIISDALNSKSTWSWLGGWFTDPVDNLAQTSKAIVSGVGCVLSNLFVPSSAELGQLMEENEACSQRVTGEYGPELKALLAEGSSACRISDLWGVVYNDISIASEGDWPRCKQPFVDLTGLSQLDLVENILDADDDGTVQADEGDNFQDFQGGFAVDACSTGGEDSILKSASPIIKPIATVGMLLFLLIVIPRLLMYALTLSGKEPKV